LAAATIATTMMTVCANEPIKKKKTRRLWIMKLFQQRMSMGCHPALVREFRDEDPEAFRRYLSMDTNI
jgi:hypothetical protein